MIQKLTRRKRCSDKRSAQASVFLLSNRASDSPERRLCPLQTDAPFPPPTERLFHFVPNEPHPGTKKDFFSSVLHLSTPANRTEHGLLHTHENWYIFAGN